MKMFEKEREVILNNNFEIVKEYSLVNNYGYIVKVNNNEYDLRHWRNIYGAEINYWEISGKVASEEDKNKLIELQKEMNEYCR